MNTSDMEENNRNQWQDFDDALRSISSLSRMAKDKPLNVGKQRPQLKSFQSLNEIKYSHYNPQNHNLSETKDDYLAYRKPLSMGRGKMLQDLGKQFTTIEFADQIHSELKELNSCGYSNEEIEREFGSPLKFVNDVSQIESEVIYIDHEEKEEDLKKTIPGDSEDAVCQPSSISVIEVSEVPHLQDTRTSQEIKEESQIEIPVGHNKKRTDNTVAKQLKGKQRKIRNMVLLNFTNKEKMHSNVNPPLKEPNEFLKSSSSNVPNEWALANSIDSIFSPSDFPEL